MKAVLHKCYYYNKEYGTSAYYIEEKEEHLLTNYDLFYCIVLDVPVDRFKYEIITKASEQRAFNSSDKSE